MPKSIDVVKYSTISRNHYLVQRPVDDDSVIVVTKHEVDKSISTLDHKIHNAFLAFYYSLMIDDSNGFYTSINALSSAMTNQSKSLITNQPVIQVDKVSVKPYRL